MNRKTPTSELKRLNPDEFKGSSKAPIIVVLDNIRSAQNVGSIFRTMDAFRCEELLICGISATPPHREINKTALGASQTVAWKYFNSTVDAIKSLNQKGVKTVAVEQTQNAIQLHDFKMGKAEKIAFVFGNEVKGVDQEVVNLCDSSVEIPQIGTKHSLNISVCAGIVLWEIFSKNYLEKLAES